MGARDRPRGVRSRHPRYRCRFAVRTVREAAQSGPRKETPPGGGPCSPGTRSCPPRRQGSQSRHQRVVRPKGCPLGGQAVPDRIVRASRPPRPKLASALQGGGALGMSGRSVGAPACIRHPRGTRRDAHPDRRPPQRDLASPATLQAWPSKTGSPLRPPPSAT